MAHDPIKTQKYIDDALARFSAYTAADEQNVRAFAYIRGVRRMGDEPLLKRYGITVPIDPTAPTDESLADAEHYLYMRHLGSATGDPTINSLVYAYETKKYIYEKMGKLQDLRTSPKYPVLAPSQDAITWGTKGANAGLTDYRSEHGGKLGDIGSGIKANAGFVKY